MASAARIRRLTLTNFRSYHAASLETDGDDPIALVGPNGAGKTNILEAISWLAPGRGLRNATLEDVAFNEGDGSWAVSRGSARARSGSPRSAPASSRRSATPRRRANAASTASR